MRAACVSVWRFCRGVCARRPFCCAILVSVGKTTLTRHSGAGDEKAKGREQ